VSVAEFVEQPQTLFSDASTPVRDRGWVMCAHGTTWPADNFVTRPDFFDREAFRQKTFLNHQRRFPDCDCALEAASA
jgi:hypothetical protein